MAFPDVEISSLDFTSNQQTLITTALSGNEQRANLFTQKWEMSCRFNNLSDADRRKLQGFIAEQQGALNSFEFALPGDLANSGANFSGTITTTGTGAVGATSVTVTSDNSTAILKAGDLIRFPGQNKTYMVTADVTTSGTGSATVNFLPGLLESVSSSTDITHRSVTVNMRFDGDQFRYNISPTYYGSFSLSFVEVY